MAMNGWKLALTDEGQAVYINSKEDPQGAKAYKDADAKLKDMAWDIVALYKVGLSHTGATDGDTAWCATKSSKQSLAGTPEVAVLRCALKSLFGDIIEVPEILT